MKIATWNVERLKHVDQIDTMESLCRDAVANILVLTETDSRIHPDYKYCIETPKAKDIIPGLFKDTENRVSMTSTADYYGIDGISNALLDLEESDPEVVLGYSGNLKLRSCMTLFYYASDDEDTKVVFKAVVDKYYAGEFDYRTEEMLGV